MAEPRKPSQLSIDYLQRALNLYQSTDFQREIDKRSRELIADIEVASIVESGRDVKTRIYELQNEIQNRPDAY